VVNATPPPLYPRERPGTHCIGGQTHPGITWNFSLQYDKDKIRRVPQRFKELNDQFTSAFQEDF
jgi:hypothetical protein